MRVTIPALAIFGTLALSLTSCSAANNSGTDSTDSHTPSTQISIVAATNVWGSIAEEIAGDTAKVTSIISSPSQDPHGYEASAQDKLAVSKASVIIVNGGGYDDWAQQLAGSVANKPAVINATELSGLVSEHQHEHENEHSDKDEHGEHHHHHGDDNEHVFYSLGTAKKVAAALKDNLASTHEEDAETYTKNLESFDKKISDLQARASNLKTNTHKTSIKALATESVANYLLNDAGIENLTPPEFIEQSETESGPSPSVLSTTLELLTEKKVDVLLLNGQTSDAISKQLKEAAEKSGIKVVEVWETLPEGISNYPDFISSTLDNLEAALK